MTNEELLDAYDDLQDERCDGLRGGNPLPKSHYDKDEQLRAELLRRMGAAVSASPQPDFNGAVTSILANCAARYANPRLVYALDPQSVIDKQIDNGVEILKKFFAADWEPPYSRPECHLKACESAEECKRKGICKFHYREAKAAQPVENSSRYLEKCLREGPDCDCVGVCKLRPEQTETASAPQERTITLTALWHLLFPEGTEGLDFVHNDVGEWLDHYTEEVERHVKRLVAPSVAGTQPTPTLIDVDGIAEKIAHEIWEEQPKMHGNLRCWPGTHTIAEKIKQHFRPFAHFGAAQGTQQVEEISREIANSVIGPLLHAAKQEGKISTNFLDEVAIETAAILRKHLVGAPAQPGTEEKRS